MGVFLPPSFFSLTSLFESSLSRVSVPQGSLPVLSLLLTDNSGSRVPSNGSNQLASRVPDKRWQKGRRAPMKARRRARRRAPRRAPRRALRKSHQARDCRTPRTQRRRRSPPPLRPPHVQAFLHQLLPLTLSSLHLPLQTLCCHYLRERIQRRSQVTRAILKASQIRNLRKNL